MVHAKLSAHGPLLSALFGLALALPACAHAPAGPPHGTPGHEGSDAPAFSRPDDDRLGEVARIHGGAGPWAVAGYRMGEHALRRLGLPRQSFDLEVVHHTPREVQFSCIADGASAATGASLGKLNLSLVEADAAHVVTIYRRRSTGKAIALRTSAAFVELYRDVPRARLGEAGREVMALPDAEVFEEVPPPAGGAAGALP